MDITFFDQYHDRSNTGAYKWEAHKVPGPYYSPVPADEIVPMWIADTDFATAPSVVEAIAKRISHPLFGYTIPSPEYFAAISRWHVVNMQYVRSVVGDDVLVESEKLHIGRSYKQKFLQAYAEYMVGGT